MIVGTIVIALTVSACGSTESSANEVTITVTVDATGGPGTFTAEGGAICPGGTVTTVDFALVEGGATFRDQYDCADGSGTFFIGGEVDIAADSPTYAGTWSVEEGNGTQDFMDAQGSGTLAGVTEPDWIVEYEGTFSVVG